MFESTFKLFPAFSLAGFKPSDLRIVSQVFYHCAKFQSCNSYPLFTLYLSKFPILLQLNTKISGLLAIYFLNVTGPTYVESYM
jgi:hypothetical protein